MLLLQPKKVSLLYLKKPQNGVSSYWKTFLNEKSEKNRFIRFKHNRFNLVFVLGYAVYYHHEDISIFLETVHGTTNDLLMVTLIWSSSDENCHI
jgi:hypothetical protein